jgi:hypothetical protein
LLLLLLLLLLMVLSVVLLMVLSVVLLMLVLEVVGGINVNNGDATRTNRHTIGDILYCVLLVQVNSFNNYTSHQRQKWWHGPLPSCHKFG